MAESATMRESKRAQIAHRISHCAQVLADEHGLDGFTLEALAEAAGVSRRTLFNYFPSKIDAVLGTGPVPDPAVVATFQAGGPHGVLLDDLGVMVTAVLEDKRIEREDAARIRRLMCQHPRLLAAAHDGMSKFGDMFAEAIVQRETGAVDATDARILFRVVLSIFDTALDDFIVSADDRSLSELYAEHFGRLRALLA